MTDRKKTREIVGYTHAKQMVNADSWYKTAISFHEAARVLYDHKERISSGIRIFAFNAGLSLELIIKARLAAISAPIPFTHNLIKLATKATLTLTAEQMETLQLLSEVIGWRGRYPTPRRAEAWDHYHDKVLPKHVNTRGADPKRFPYIDNYMAIWNACLEKYRSEPNQTASSPERLSMGGRPSNVCKSL